MWVVSAGKDLQMTEGDYGIDLPVVINGAVFGSGDVISFVVKTSINGTQKVNKTFSDISEGVVNIKLSSSDTANLPVGTYVYSLDWYRSGTFMCNIIPFATFKVVEKA